ncbi:hypothetical protein OsI_03126 [Oryza sativa Indica Group]|uniref:Uncharacterized protein n=1 Tax=Oryza sativa subsp. indica TaxID=39946 RepID=A2WTE2_ORYSI|nr:hypothetical protein OsI_03126 [Oryza sativa Indica Group]
MATGGLDPAAREAELAHLPGPKLVDHLCTTHRRADYEAVARVLDARDRRLEAALAENEDLRRKCDALLVGQRRPREEEEEEAAGEKPPPGIIAAPEPARRDEEEVEGSSEEGEVRGVDFIDLSSSSSSSDDEEKEVEAGRGAGSRVPIIKEAPDDAEGDEDDTLPLSQLWKRRRLGEPGAVKSEKGDGHNPVDSGGNDPPKCTSARTDVPEASTGEMVSRPGDSMVAAFVQGKGTVQPENVGGEMPRVMLHSPAQVIRSTLQKRKFGKKDGSSAIPGDTTSSQARSTSLAPKREGSAAVPGYTTSSQARNTGLSPKKCRDSTSPDDEMCNALADSVQVGAGSTMPRGPGEQDKGIGAVQRATVLHGTSGIGEQGGKLDSTPTKVRESNRREGGLQNKSIDSKSNDALKHQDKKDGRMVQKGDLSVQSCVPARPIVASVPSVTKNSEKGNSAKGVSQPPKGNDQMNKMSMVESSSKCGYEKVGADVQKCSPLPRQSEEGSVARGVVSFEETGIATVHPLSIRNLSGPELRNLNKGGGELSKKLVVEGSPKYGEKNNDARSEKNSSPLGQSEDVKIIREGASNEEPRVGRLSPSILSNYSTGEQIHSVSKNAELCSPTAKKALFEPGSSCTPLKHTVCPPSSGKSISIQAKGEINLLPSAMSRHWETAAHMIASLRGNMELSMQALCALYRQRKLVIMSTEGQQTGTTGLTKIDAVRAIRLLEFLLDGKLKGPLKRTAKELLSHDATGPTFLEKVALSFSKELFDIYKNKKDPYFC